MNKKKNLFVFLDTNTHLHFQSFDEIDWRKALGVSRVNLIFTHTILKELEKKKIERTTKLVGKRAERAIKRISRLLEEESTEIKKNIFIDFLAEPLNRSWFDKLNLNESIGDDCVLAEILFFCQKHAAAEVLLVTNDLGLRVRAKHFSIKTFTLPENFQVPPEIDEDKKKIQQLEKENVELKLKKPELKLVFKNKDEKENYFLVAPESFNTFDNWIALGNIRAKYPKLEIPEVALQLSNSELKEKLKTKDEALGAELANTILACSELLFQTPVIEYERYNAEIEQFHHTYSSYLQELQNTKNALNLILECSIELSNYGTAPAEDIDIFLELPTGIKFIHPEEFPKEPVQPNSPKPPEPIAAMIGRPIANKARKLFGLEQAKSVTLLASQANVTHPHSERFLFSDDRQKAGLKFKELKHYYSIPLPIFHVIFNSFNEAKSFEINYKILPKNLPRPITGKLHIIIEKQQFIPPLLKLISDFS